MFRYISTETWDRAIDAYLSGSPLTASAALVGISDTGLANEMERRGIPRRPLCPFTKVDESRFSVIDTEEQAYWLGFLYTDGWVCTKYRMVGLCSGGKDAGHIAAFARFMGTDRPPRVEHRPASGLAAKEGVRVTFTARSERLVADLKRHGCHDRKTWTCRPWDGPEHLMRHFWRGCIDGDGTIGMKDGGWSCDLGFCGNEAMVKGFSRFAGGGKIRATKPTGREAKAAGLLFYAVRWTSLVTVQRVASMLYDDATVFLPRKREIAERIIKRQYVRTNWNITREELLALFAEHGNWNAVGRAMGASDQNAYKMARNRGITPEDERAIRKPTVRKWGCHSHITRESLAAALAEHGGSLSAVARSMGVPYISLYYIRKRFGV